MPGISTSRERGFSMVTGIMGLAFVIPFVGLAVDVGILYAVKSRLQSAVDGSALAAARALNLGATTAAQASTAKQNAVNWFYANFPNGNWATFGTDMSSAKVNVFDDPVNPNLRNVTVTVTTKVPTYFMRLITTKPVTVAAVGNASRRDAVVMMVLDRSGSMQNSPGACTAMKNAAKLFTGQFAAGRDRIGLVSFSDNYYLHSAPTTNFRATLGYKDAAGTGTGAIDSIVCAGGTSTAQAISIAHNEMYKVNLPGALNVLMFETDGLPNTLTMNFYDSATNTNLISNSSPCRDKASKTKTTGGFATASSIPAWTAGTTFGTGSLLSSLPAGMVAAVASSDPGPSTKTFFAMLEYKTTTTASNFNSTAYVSTTAAPGCTFQSSHTPTSLAADIAYLPETDAYGNLLDTGWQSINRSSGKIQSSNWTTFHNAVLNATDNAAKRARTNTTLPVHFFGIGLGGTSTSPPVYVMMQRMANDSNGDIFNNPPVYPSCASTPGCATNVNEPSGTFLFTTNPNLLGQAFLSLSSQILRLSK